MSGVYGEFIGFFSELFEDFKIFKHEDDRISGYKLTFDRKIRAIKQTYNEAVDTKRYKELPILDIVQKWAFWCYEKLNIVDEFVEIDGEIYRPMTNAHYNREGGFWEYTLEKVIGNDGTKEVSPELSEPEW